MKLNVMARQPGLTWDAIDNMPIVSFFHTLKLTEKKAMAEQEKIRGKGSKAVRLQGKKNG